MINECTNLTTGADVDFRWSLFGPSVHEHLTQEQANDCTRSTSPLPGMKPDPLDCSTTGCHRAWDHDSWSDIVSLLLVIGNPNPPSHLLTHL